MNQPPELSHNRLRLFGVLVAVLILTLFKLMFPWWFGIAAGAWPWWAAAGIAVLGLVFPAVLAQVYHGWMWIGHRVGRVLTPVLLAIVFFAMIVPMGLLLRLRRDPMRRRLDPGAETYRQPAEPLADDDLERPF